MLRLSKKVDYGILILAHIARRGDAASAAEIARAYNLSRPFVANILKELTRKQLLMSTRGAAGGYELAMEAEELSLSDVVTALEGEFRMAECAGSAGTGTGCDLEGLCPTSGPLREVHGRIDRFLRDVSLQAIADGDLEAMRA